MNQDAFRNLLANSQQSQPDVKWGIPATANNTPQKATTSTPSKLAFKPRKVKKVGENKYRDRAAERREGTGNDYADVEAVLEDFERRVAHEDRDTIEQQRKYLGGDSQHTILVKGLDRSLLEQNRARAATSTEYDAILEQAFTEVTSISGPIESKKRTREDIIRELKAKRQNGETSTDQSIVAKSLEGGTTLEAAKNAGKFRPIGFQPIANPEEKSKKRKPKERKESVKTKKQKVEGVLAELQTKDKPVEETPAMFEEPNKTQHSPSHKPQKPPEPDPLNEYFEIFAGAGDYEGFPVDEESEEEQRDVEGTKEVSRDENILSPVPPVGTRGWFDEPGLEARHASILPRKSLPISEIMETEEEPQDIRLEPLESSALPSIRDFLAVDEAAEKAEKRKARKEKKKKKKRASGDDDD